MITQRFGLRLGLGYDQLSERSGTPRFTTDYYAASLEGVANLGKVFNFTGNRFTMLLHAGLGYSALDGRTSSTDVNHMMHAVGGITPQFRLNDRWSFYVDAMAKAHVYQQTTWDATQRHSDPGIDGYIYNLSVGFQVNLGPHAKHADWASENMSQEEITAMRDRIRQLEEQQKDDDGDGVANYLDQEPGTPAGTTVDTKGRTVVEKPRDSDSDGITDDVDDCPFEKGGPRTRGCPEASNSGTTGSGGTAGNSAAIAIIENSEVKFATDAANVTPSFGNMLNGIIAIMKDNPSYNVNIVGHADDRASEEYNMALSQRRADAVKAYMVSKGISASRLSTTARGESQPKVKGTSVEARAENRRVQFILNR
jgi:OOP family OmpA-OmpF porin